MEKLLDDVIVLDMTRVLAGPYCAMLLSDMGAKVIKVEIPGHGDDSRAYGPYQNGVSMYYAGLNRGKKGMTVNLKKDKGKELFRELVKQVDIVLESFRPGTMEKLGLGYDTLHLINSKLIYGSISGFGHTGPYAKRAGYDIIGQAMGGLMSTTGWPDSEPTRTGTPMGDVLGGLNLAIGVLGALHRQRKTGKGEKVDVALVDAVVSAMQNINMIYTTEGRIPQKIGNRYESTYPYDSFRAKDGSVIIAAANKKLYDILCTTMRREDLITDPRFDTIRKRLKNHEAMKEEIEKWSRERTIDEVADTLNAAGVPSSPINTIDRVVKNEQIAGARNMFPIQHHPVAGDIVLTNNALKFTETNADPDRPAPDLGADNAFVYGNLLGLSIQEQEDLKKEGII
ncbi:MAG: CoA transferase [Peptoniphilaceae bacterium]|nr:CoA transferase [Peptoniphilaceae bacterium]